MQSQPPPIIDSAKVLAYAVLDSTITHTGKAKVYYAGRLVGPVSNLAICRNEGKTPPRLRFTSSEN
jgi:hypothetical protein